MFKYDEFAKHYRLYPHLLWLRNSPLEDSECLPEPEVLAAEMVEDLSKPLEEFKGIID